MPFFANNKDNFELQFEKPNVNFLVEEDSDVVKFYKIIKKLDFSAFYKRYSQRGAAAYRPETLFAIIIMSIFNGLLSSRAIEARCKYDINYLFFTEYRKPDHSTIARFLRKFDKEIAGLLAQLVILAKENNIASFQTIAIDGSKFQSASSKVHSKRMRELVQDEKRLVRQLEKVMNLMRENDKKDNRDEKEEKRLEKKQKDLTAKLQTLKDSKEELGKRQESIKEKKDKENHQINTAEWDARMMNDIKANGYNVQLSVDAEVGFIANVSVEVDRADYSQFSKQHQKTEEVLGEDKQRVYLADAGYMTSEALSYVEENGVDAYINSREITEVPEPEELLEKGLEITSEYFIYSESDDVYLCPNKRKLKRIDKELYESEDCSGCILKLLCAKNKDVRRVTRSKFRTRREKIQEKIKQNPEKMLLRKSVERVFGNIKWNHGFERFTRKGLDGARVEIFMIVLALNIKKIANAIFFFFQISLNKRIFPIIRHRWV